MTTTVAVDWRVPLDHPAFAGHFPGQPIVPGVLLIAQALEAAAAHLDAAWLIGRVSGARPPEGADSPLGGQRAWGPVQIAQAKFLAPLEPGDACTIELHDDASPSMRLRFDIRRGDVLAATGVLRRDAA